MATSYLPYEPQQQRLLPDALQNWLPEGQSEENVQLASNLRGIQDAKRP